MKRKLLSAKEWKRLISKGLPVESVAVKKRFDCEEIKQVGDEEDRVLQFTISSGAVDRQGDTIDPNGWQLDNFMKSGSVLWNHNSREDRPPIAKPLAVWVEDGKLKARAEFTPEHINPFGYQIYQMFQGGYIKGVSVGFRAIKHSVNEDRGGFWPTDFLEQELLEFSAAPVQANPDAMVEAKAAGIDVAAIEAYFDAMTKGTISYSQAHPDGTPKAAKDTSWDGIEQTSEATVDGLKVMCAWVESDNADTKGGYKLPHHAAAGAHSVVWNGVVAAMQALMGERGDIDIPDGDRKGAYNHLVKHYKEFDEDAPEFKAADIDAPDASAAEPKSHKATMHLDFKLTSDGDATLKRLEAMTDKLHKCLFENPLAEPVAPAGEPAPAAPEPKGLSKDEFRDLLKEAGHELLMNEIKTPLFGIVD